MIRCYQFAAAGGGGRGVASALTGKPVTKTSSSSGVAHMGVPGNVFQRAPLEVTSHVRESDVRVLSFGIEDDHALTLRFAVLSFGDVAELHRALGAWLDEVRRHEREKLAQATSKVTVVEFRKKDQCHVCGGDHPTAHFTLCVTGGGAA